MAMHDPPANAEGDNPFGARNPFSDNPYAPPAPPAAAGADPAFYAMSAHASSRKLVAHVPVVAILMMVQGGLELLMGLGLAVMAGVFPLLLELEQGPAREVPPFEAVRWIMLAVYGGLGLLTIAAAVLHFLAGLRNYRFRSRTLGVVALAAGLVTVFSCYCAPTSIALAVYGLIVYLNADVAQAFQMGQAGQSKEEILGKFRNPFGWS